MANRFDDARLSIGYLRAMASRRKLKRSARSTEKERDALRQLYGREHPIAPENELADGSDSVSTDEKVFHTNN